MNTHGRKRRSNGSGVSLQQQGREGLAALGDDMFNYVESPNWKNGAAKNPIYGFERQVLEPTAKTDRSYSFDFPSTSTIAFGPMTGFVVKCGLQMRTKARAAQNVAAGEWTQVPAANAKDFRLIPNWFEHCIKSLQVFHNNTVVTPHNMPRHVMPYINSYLYAYMDSRNFNCLFPEEHNPGRGTPLKESDWDPLSDGTMWSEFAKTFLGKASFVFRYIPGHIFPFYQGANFCDHDHGSGHGGAPRALHMPSVGRMSVTLELKESFDIIQPKSDSQYEYQMLVQSVQLAVQEVRLSNAYERALASSKRLLHFEGVTMIGVTEAVSTTSYTHRFRFQDVVIPEGIFIFALPNTVTNGSLKYNQFEAKRVFLDHNIEGVEVFIEGQRLYIKSPNPSNMRHSQMEVQTMMDHTLAPPFGVHLDESTLQYGNFRELGENTFYPHVYIPLCLPEGGGPDTRMVAIGEEGSFVRQRHSMDVAVKFLSDKGPKNNASYFCFLFFTDVNMTLDLKTKTFKPFYAFAGSNM